MVLHVLGDILSYIQSFLAHLLVHEPMLLAFQPLPFLGLELSEGVMKIFKQSLRKQPKNEEYEDEGDDSCNSTQQQYLAGETLKKRMLQTTFGHSSLNPLLLDFDMASRAEKCVCLRKEQHLNKDHEPG
jgi:hypothetical protein